MVENIHANGTTGELIPIAGIIAGAIQRNIRIKDVGIPIKNNYPRAAITIFLYSPFSTLSTATSIWSVDMLDIKPNLPVFIPIIGMLLSLT